MEVLNNIRDGHTPQPVEIALDTSRYGKVQRSRVFQYKPCIFLNGEGEITLKKKKMYAKNKVSKQNNSIAKWQH